MPDGQPFGLRAKFRAVSRALRASYDAEGVGGGAPKDTIVFFYGTTCPSGWAEYSDARGRYLVGLRPGGALGSGPGTALGDQENRAVGKHTHSLNQERPLLGGAFCGGGGGCAAWIGGEFSFSIGAAGSVDGTNAPYIQLLVCKKN